MLFHRTGRNSLNREILIPSELRSKAADAAGNRTHEIHRQQTYRQAGLLSVEKPESRRAGRIEDLVHRRRIKMKNFELKTIAINKLAAHPANPNVMSEVKFNKLVRNIERTGLYEPIVVRAHPKKKDYFQIINGHHRVKALEKLDRKVADCVVWDVDDEQAEVLLATLNRLTGSDEPARKIELGSGSKSDSIAGAVEIILSAEIDS
jgi:hypothetical protein